MNFTREPIIETIVTPKDGYKLLIRNSKLNGGEEYTVDAIEVVSFGNALFFRSQERPKSFLVPVSDFEVIEVKETRVVLKSATFEKAIKIGGGKEVAAKEKERKEEVDQEAASMVEQRLEKKRERRRHKRRRSTSPQGEALEDQTPSISPAEGEGTDPLPPVLPGKVLLPPPTHLISDKLASQRIEAPPANESEETLPKIVKEKSKEKPKRVSRKKKASVDKAPEEKEKASPKDTEPLSNDREGRDPLPDGGGVDAQRVATEMVETVTSTSFSTLDPLDEPFGKTW